MLGRWIGLKYFGKGVLIWVAALAMCFVGIYTFANIDRTFGAIAVVLGIVAFIFGGIFIASWAFEENKPKEPLNKEEEE